MKLNLMGLERELRNILLISTYLRDSKWRSGQFDIYVRNTKGRE
jgi:hypothetical protein